NLLRGGISLQLLGENHRVAFALIPDVSALGDRLERSPQSFQQLQGRLVHVPAVVELVGNRDQLFQLGARGGRKPLPAPPPPPLQHSPPPPPPHPPSPPP